MPGISHTTEGSERTTEGYLTKVSSGYLIENVTPSKTPVAAPKELIETPENFDNGKTAGYKNSRVDYNAVSVQNSCKQYGSQTVLKNFNMAVQKNTIYGLLGASGCGKTTILSCIIGLRTLDSGTISICGYPTGTKESGIPGRRVGYMPQEIALNSEFKINEVLQYFGRIYGMTQTRVQERCDYLVKLLSLEKCKENLIRNMSDGQKRRVSLAVTLLHEPEILILDEPTVGCDALLRQTIWDFLNELVAQDKATVIVTTHYIEETRQADRVGIMRNGRLLVEDAPNKLLIKYNANLLDDIVLKLCEKDEAGEIDQDGNHKIEGTIMEAIEVIPNLVGTNQDTVVANGHSTAILGIEDFSGSFWHRLWALIIKNVLVLSRNLWLVFFLLTLPSMVFFLFSFIISAEPTDIKIGVVNAEFPFNNNNNNRFGNSVCASSTIKRSCGSIVNLSCLYLNSLDKRMIDLVLIDSTETAINQVQTQKLWGFIQFDSNFSGNIFSRLMLGKNNNLTIKASQIKIRLDMTNSGLAMKLKKEFNEGFRRFNKNLFDSCGVNPMSRDLSVKFDSPIYGPEDLHIIYYIGPGMAMTTNFFFCAVTCGLTYLIEKKDGMINRILVTGVQMLEIILSHFILQFVILIIQVSLNLLLLFYIFEIECLGSMIFAILAIIIGSVSGMSLGFLAATFCNDEKNAMLLAMAFFFPGFMLTGAIWPIESLPKIMQAVSYLTPVTLIEESFRSIIHRGVNFWHESVWIGFSTALIWIFLYWAIIFVFHRFHRRI